jgi:hypothetical protein
VEQERKILDTVFSPGYGNGTVAVFRKEAIFMKDTFVGTIGFWCWWWPIP